VKIYRVAQRIPCRMNCGACCTEISISPSNPSLPKGKPAGVRCPYLTDNDLCSLFGKPERPRVCSSFPAMMDVCGQSKEEAIQLIREMERLTTPDKM